MTALLEQLFDYAVMSAVRFVKRHPVLASALVLLIVLLPPLVQVLQLLDTFAGLSKAWQAVKGWQAKHPTAYKVLSVSASLFIPGGIVFLALWHLADQFKASDATDASGPVTPGSTSNESPSPAANTAATDAMGDPPNVWEYWKPGWHQIWS